MPWFHIVTLTTKLSEPTQRAWYAQEAIAQGWSRDTLATHIAHQLHARQGTAVTNFAQRLEPAQAGLAIQVLKDPYPQVLSLLISCEYGPSSNM